MNGLPEGTWRDATSQEQIDGLSRLVLFDDMGRVKHAWVREEPVPPLPTEPYTVIRVTWMNPNEASDKELILVPMNGKGVWSWLDGVLYSKPLERAIYRFEVLSEPRAVTAKTVLDRVRKTVYTSPNVAWDADRWDKVGSEFGVEL